MKNYLILFSAILLCYSCKKDPEDPIIADPKPIIHSFQGAIGVNDNSTIFSVDNNLLICGNTPSGICALKLSKTGSQIWRKDYDAGEGSTASAIAQTSNGDIFICGTTYRNETISNIDVLLIKTNSSGDTVWTKTYGGIKNDYGSYIIPTLDGNLLICGISRNYTFVQYGYTFLIKINTNGDTLWSRTFTEDLQIPYHILQTHTGEFLITGTIEDSTTSGKMNLIKVNNDGLQTWSRKIESARERWVLSTVELPNGDLATCGSINDDVLDQISLVKTDGLGNIIWEKEYGETHLAETGYAIQINADGTFIITGLSFENHSGQTGIVLLKVDENGDQLIRKDFGFALIDYGKNILKDTNDDNIITGQYNGAIFLTRTDNNCVFK